MPFEDPQPDPEIRQQSKVEQEIRHLRLLNLLLLIALLEANDAEAGSSYATRQPSLATRLYIQAKCPRPGALALAQW